MVAERGDKSTFGLVLVLIAFAPVIALFHFARSASQTFKAFLLQEYKPSVEKEKRRAELFYSYHRDQCKH